MSREATSNIFAARGREPLLNCSTAAWSIFVEAAGHLGRILRQGHDAADRRAGARARHGTRGISGLHRGRDAPARQGAAQDPEGIRGLHLEAEAPQPFESAGQLAIALRARRRSGQELRQERLVSSLFSLAWSRLFGRPLAREPRSLFERLVSRLLRHRRQRAALARLPALDQDREPAAAFFCDFVGSRPQPGRPGVPGASRASRTPADSRFPPAGGGSRPERQAPSRPGRSGRDSSAGDRGPPRGSTPSGSLRALRCTARAALSRRARTRPIWLIFSSA